MFSVRWNLYFHVYYVQSKNLHKGNTVVLKYADHENVNFSLFYKKYGFIIG
jgi:hypothetical protein